MAKKDLLKNADALTQKAKNEIAAKKGTLVGNYSKWLEESEKNKALENTDLTPAVPVSKYPLYQGTATPTTDTGTSTKDYTKWTVSETVPTTTPTPTETEGGYEQWVPDTETKTEAVTVVPEGEGEQKVEGEGVPKVEGEKGETEESGFAKWLASDPAMQQRMKQAEADFYKNRAGYGVSGETLAQSGLIGSGWSSAMDAAAYSAMQAEKAGIRSEGYAKWLNEGGDTGGNVSAKVSTLFNDFLAEGITELTEADNARYIASGWSQSDIDEAKALLKDYRDKEKAESATRFRESLNTLMGDGTAADFLGSFGVSTEGMTDKEINDAIDASVEQAFKDNLITEEERSAYYKAGQIVDEDTTLWTFEEMAEKTSNSVTNAKKYLDEGKLTKADYDEILKTAYDKLGVSEIRVGDAGEDFTSATDIKITVNVNGNKRTYTFDRAGKMMITDKQYESTLNRLFGDSPLAVCNEKYYFQYKDGEWVEIGVKSGSKGGKDEGNDVLRVVAEYVNASGMKEVKEPVKIDQGWGNSIKSEQVYIR